jgi:alkylation response protein AidB-like acyl-CoA dehydrogenase
LPETPLLDAAHALAPEVRAAAARTERDRRLPLDLVDAFVSAGLFRMLVPRSFGGSELAPADMVRVIEEVSRADGAAGWCVAIAATSGVLSAYLLPDVARQVYGPANAVTGGVFAPAGRAVTVPGGYRVTGRWPFASGCQHCGWLMGGCVVLDDGAPRLRAPGVPDARLMLFPAPDARIIDTWHVAGLCGTGSHDIAVEDVFVPDALSVSLMTDAPVERGPLYTFPVFGLLALGIAAVTLGIARAAIDELVRLAVEKTPSMSRRRLADRAVVQTEVAEAEATLSAARAFVFAAIEAAWQTAAAGKPMAVGERVRLRLATTHAASSAARVVERMYTAGGGTAIYAASPLQRQFRDVHTATHHIMVAPASYELAGRILLGLETDTAML